jgi:lichenan operon transcriptional antiterminator
MNPEQWLSLKWNGGSTMSDRWLNQSKIIQRREEITGTDLAKHVALPHPYETTSDISFACISVLDHPIRWTRQDVQVVILMAVAEDEQRDLTNFLQLISEFIANESAVLQLVEEPDFTTFVNLLSQIEM